MNKHWRILVIAFASILIFLAGFQNIREHVKNSESEEVVIDKVVGKVTIDGDKYSLSNSKRKVGDKLKVDFELDKPASVSEDQSQMNLNEINGWRIIETVPSLDTPVCSMQSAELNMFAPQYEDVSFIVISQDLPFAQKRFCGADGQIADNVFVLSDYREREFSRVNGLLIQDVEINTRAILVLDPEDVVQYVEYTDEVTHALNLQNALNYLKENKK